jgi:hypothetical protein
MAETVNFFPLLKTFLENFSVLMLFIKTSSIFFFTSWTSAKRFLFFWPFIRGNGKSRVVQGQVNREDQQLISLTENKTSRTLFVVYYQPS